MLPCMGPLLQMEKCNKNSSVKKGNQTIQRIKKQDKKTNNGTQFSHKTLKVEEHEHTKYWDRSIVYWNGKQFLLHQ